MQAMSGPMTVEVESAARFYDTVVWGSADRKVDLPGAAKAGNIAGILLPKANTADADGYAAGEYADLAFEEGRVIRFNKATGYTVSPGDKMVVYDTNGNLAPTGEASISAGDNVEMFGFATESSASADEWGFMKIAHSVYQG
jgi:hypothetical protein